MSKKDHEANNWLHTREFITSCLLSTFAKSAAPLIPSAGFLVIIIIISGYITMSSTLSGVLQALANTKKGQLQYDRDWETDGRVQVITFMISLVIVGLCWTGIIGRLNLTFCVFLFTCNFTTRKLSTMSAYG